MNLDTLSRKELLSMRDAVEAALETLETRRKSEARKAAAAIAAEHGFDLEELLSAEKKTKKKGQKNPPKYRNPADASQTWTGRGRQPGWIKEALADNKSLDAFEI
ncbi:H-NS family nucleoid-associated regulatory protein [Oceaniovalibus sp. ACAM 378]|jgi:DNA-binding protein H-NS|uniref:H-NS histone family protein n=1 Tax=Oceaniovalibus sp. ACAM 378 TaxID=2599923 RepID=UPI0011D96449|nr:H-NS histone family protein [Oceaniovalibus sp. ACAM 378]TYB90239.1 H-NS histone family protein [Oceaniovalibus sp. ACAM 378]